MKHALYYVILIFFTSLCIPLQAIHSEESFLQANQLYEKQEYKKAIELYQQVKNPGVAVMYNMSLCFFYVQDYAQSLLYALRAKKLSLHKQQYDIVQQQVDNAQKGLKHSFAVDAWYEKYIHNIPMLYIQLLVILLTLLYTYAWYKQWFSHHKVLVITLYIVMMASYGLWYIKWEMANKQQGVIMKEAKLLAGPDVTFHDKQSLQPGEMVKVVRKQEDFYQVKMPSMMGWVKEENIELV
jgi:tetratricopeptide (TPR) repeat protein